MREIPSHITTFTDAVEIDWGGSGMVYKVTARSQDREQVVAVKFFERLTEFELERDMYTWMVAHGTRRFIPDVFGWRKWTTPHEFQRQFPSLSTIDRPPGAGGLFMEWLGDDMKQFEDPTLEKTPADIAEYIHVVEALRGMRVAHLDFAKNVFLVGVGRRIVVLDCAYASNGLAVERLDYDFTRRVQNVLNDYVSPLS
jgi:hypothetical protein